jgi:multiple sugar transport system substrate-binding protein
MARNRFTRRQVLWGTLGLATLATPLVSACSQAPAPAPTAPPVEKVVTQVVEKQVTQVVTQVVEKQVTQVVEKVVTPTAAPASTTLGAAEIIWHAWGNEDTGFKGWRKQISFFNEKYPQVKVNLQPEGGFDKLAVMFAAGTAPDMFFQNVPSGYAFIGHGTVLSLTPYIMADKAWQSDMQLFNKPMVDMHTFRSELYAIPQSLETSGTIYNLDMITKAGLTPPAELGDQWTWDKFREYAAKLTSKGAANPDKVWGAYLSPDPQSGLGDFVYPLVEGTNNAWVNDDGVSTGVDSKEFIQGAQFLSDIVLTDKSAPPPSFLTGQSATAYALFVNEKVGMMLSGDWAFGWILTRQLPDKKFKMDWTPSPLAPNGKTSAVGHCVANAVWAKTKYRDQVLAFERMYSTKPLQSEITNNWENYPALAPRTDAQDYFWQKKLIPNETGIRKSYDIGKAYPRSPVGDVSPLVVSPVNDAMDAVLDGKDTRKVDEVLKNLAKKINDSLTKAAKSSGNG